MDINQLREWLGSTEFRSDQATLVPIAALSATLDIEAPFSKVGDPIPPLWHWLYFLPITRQSEIGADGHAKRGGFLPPVPLPRRMWAGGRLQFHHPLRAGDAISRSSRVVDISHKAGRSGALVFILVRHEISNGAGIAVTEEQDIVYRDHPGPAEAALAPKAAWDDQAWQRQIDPDEVMLFRYSALTFNGHRIHYDNRYATAVEGYPGLVVHAPLIATLLMDLLRRNLPQASVAGFSFRADKPLFALSPFLVCGRSENQKTILLWAKDVHGELAMDAIATLA